MTAYAINGLALHDAVVTFHRTGAFSGDLLTSDLSAIPLDAGTQLTIDFGDLAFVAVVARGGSFRGSEWTRIVGGHGGLGLTAAPAGFVNAPLVEIARTMLAAVGETLSSTVTAATLPALFETIPRWMVRAEPVAKAIARLALAAGGTWRMLPDGTVWIGVDTWEPKQLPTATFMDAHPERGEEMWGVVAPELLPGVTLAAPDRSPGRVSVVQYDLQPDRMRMHVWHETGEHRWDRDLQPMADVVGALTDEFDYLGEYPCEVIAQNADGTLDIQPEDERFSGMQSVPLSFGVPGVRATMPVGARVYLAFANGSPAGSYIRTYDPTVLIPGSVSIQINGLPAIPPLAQSDLKTWIAQVTLALNGLVPGSVTAWPFYQ